MRRHCSHRWRVCLFTVALALGAPASTLAKQVVIATIGDFLTLGEESDTEETSTGPHVGDAGKSTAYPAVLAARLGAEAKIFNYGVHRATMRGGGIVSYSNTVQHLKAIHSNPDVVLIMLGTNDARVGYWDKREFLKGAEALIHDFSDLATRPFIALLQPPPLYKDGAISMNRHVVNDMLGTVLPQAVALSGGNAVYSKGIFDALGGSEMNCKKCFFAAGHVNDGCHPTEYGYQRMAEAVYALLVGRGILTGLGRAAPAPSTSTITTEVITTSTFTTATFTTATFPPTTILTMPPTTTTTLTTTKDLLDSLMQPLPLADVQTTKPDGGCDEYMGTTGCGWTKQFSCPGEPHGSDGSSSNDGTLGYTCCCAAGMWKDGTKDSFVPPQTAQSAPLPGVATFGLPNLRAGATATAAGSGATPASVGAAKAWDSTAGAATAGSPSPSQSSPSPVPGLSMPLPQGLPQSLAQKLAKKARNEFDGESVAEERAEEQMVSSGQQRPAQADERQGRQDRGEVVQEKQLAPDSKESNSSALQSFCSLVASYAVPIGSGLLPCAAGAFLLYQAKKNGFIPVAQDPGVADFDYRRSASKRSRSDRRY
jgi:lysophospholipase L1-like esterase